MLPRDECLRARACTANSWAQASGAGRSQVTCLPALVQAVPEGICRPLPQEGGAWAGAPLGEGKLDTQPERWRVHNSGPLWKADGRAGTWLGGAEGRYTP